MEFTSKRENEQAASSHYFPPKKSPLGATFYLRAAALNQASKVEQLPPTKENWPEYERLRALAMRLRANAGEAWWAVIIFAGACGIIILLWLASRTHDTYLYRYPADYLRVVKNLDPCLPDGSCGYRFVMQEVSNGVANPETEMHFCRNLQPRFEAGHTLSWIRFTNTGSCDAIDGYDVVRGTDGIATIAPNCTFDKSIPNWHVRCEGGRAQF